MIVADEAYFEFVRDPEYPDSIEDHDGRRMLVTLRTFSKIFGLAGLRVGYSVAREDITRLLNNVRQPFNITSLGLVAVEAGMDDHEHVRRTLEVNASGMAYLEGEFRRLGLPFRAEPGQFHPGRGRRGAHGLRKASATGRNCPPDERLRAAAPRARQRRAARKRTIGWWRRSNARLRVKLPAKRDFPKINNFRRVESAQGLADVVVFGVARHGPRLSRLTF